MPNDAWYVVHVTKVPITEMTLYIIIPLSMKRNGTIVPTADNAIYGESYLKEKHSRKKQDNPIGRLASSVFRDGFPPEITMQSTALAMAMFVGY